ncbi:MAG TPA: glycine--tRNA ligase subunit beta, partial [Candidatus Polarisedimenticolaceae bacterium]|nr:glycine--tRNA ligase subunit beta [Candidatus Polarisedimenticolaceae bacterium]
MTSERRSFLFEIGCEEIPSRMIPPAADDLGRRIVEILDRAELGHGLHAVWGGTRRLAVRVDDVAARQADRDETVLGPPAAVAFSADGELTQAALGFARKQGVAVDRLERLDTERGSYVGLRRRVDGRPTAAILAETVPAAVAAMPFPKSMRWGDGRPRWVRPVHWIVAIFGGETVPIELFGIRATTRSRGHRFFDDRWVEIERPDAYVDALRRAHVLIEPAERRERIETALAARAAELGGTPVPDLALLDEVADLIEWPGVVAGSFDARFLELPPELLITTLRHHQKCFSLRDDRGRLLPGFLAVGNTDRDPAGHIRRGNEWVVGGRLEDARFFWREDRKTALAALSPNLAGVTFHRKLGSYADKAERVSSLAVALAGSLGCDESELEACRRAASWCKNDLVTGTVGEFPELQGRVGGLLLAAEGGAESVWRAIYQHYQPAGAEDEVPSGTVAQVVSVADKLDSVCRLIEAGERASGSKDPLGLRRAGSGIVRVLLDGGWPITLAELAELARADEAAGAFLRERMESVLRERGHSIKEILSVTRARVDPERALAWSMIDLAARLDAIKRVRGRDDFVHLVKLT